MPRLSRLARGVAVKNLFLRLSVAKNLYASNVQYPTANSSSFWLSHWYTPPTGPGYWRIVHDSEQVLGAQFFTRNRRDQFVYWSRLFQKLYEWEISHEPIGRATSTDRRSFGEAQAVRAADRARAAAAARAAAGARAANRRRIEPESEAQAQVQAQAQAHVQAQAQAQAHAQAQAQAQAHAQAQAQAQAQARAQAYPVGSMEDMSDKDFEAAARPFDLERARRQRLESLTRHIEANPKSVYKMFICPITRDIMKDPVCAKDGHTYERAAIERVINGRATFKSPVSRKTCDSHLNSNGSLRGFIKEALDTWPIVHGGAQKEGAHVSNA